MNWASNGPPPSPASFPSPTQAHTYPERGTIQPSGMHLRAPGFFLPLLDNVASTGLMQCILNAKRPSARLCRAGRRGAPRREW